MNFLDPLLTSDGKLYAPIRYKELVRECYSISKNCNTSYYDILDLTPREKDYLIEFIVEDAQQSKELLEKVKQQNN